MQHEMRAYTAETFLPYSGQVFVFEVVTAAGSAHQPIRLKLDQVSPSKSGPIAAGFRQPFSLLFALADGVAAASGLFRLLHDDFEPCDWFLSRVIVPGGDARTAYYEAVFG
jgi:hypothetical protein